MSSLYTVREEGKREDGIKGNARAEERLEKGRDV